MKHLLLVLAALGLGSCTVYAPMQCAAPSIREKGELEVAATLNINFRAEGAVAYSPVKHVLVRAAGGFRNGFPGDNNTDTTFFRVRQYEVAAGGYWPFASRGPFTGQATVGALVGYGQAHNERGYIASQSLFGPIESSAERFRRYDGSYNTKFGELFGNLQWRRLGTGAAFRLTKVEFDQLTNRGVPFGPASLWRFEPMGFFRVRPFRSEMVQVQVGAGASFNLNNSSTDDYDTGQIKDPVLRTGFGILFYPHQLWRK
jgi:hypothetical protein